MTGSAATLNAQQMAAVHHLHSPALVLAGAGSGKTRVIVYKIARLLQAEVPAKRIAAITFTNKAALEMRERAKAIVGPRASKDLLISTFHALGVRMLREDGELLGLKPQFSILDSDDVLGVLRDIGSATDNALAKRWQWAISGWKNAGLTAAQAEAAAKDDTERQAARVMHAYEERLNAFQAVDFDDLIGLPLKLLQNHEEAATRWRERLAHVLVDEYQDTNAVQYALLKALVGHGRAAKPTPFTAVGDDDQSIYGWRGATLDNLRLLPLDFPDLTVIALEQNYRSTRAILQAANAVIAGNPKLFEKKLWSDLGEGEPVRVMACDSEEHEAERAVARLQALRGNDGRIKLADYAILYRTNFQSKAFEQKLRAAQIPYKVSGGQSFFDRAEIKDLCAWLRLLVNEDDDPAFLRAITTPKRGIGHTTLAKLGEFAAQRRESLFAALFAPSLSSALSAKQVAQLHEFGRWVNDLQREARHTVGAEAAKAWLLEWLKTLGYEQHLYEGEDREALAAARWKNVLDFIDWAARRCGGTLSADQPETGLEAEPKSVLDVAQSISVILSLAEREGDQDVVTLTTLHAAKGLEWPHVFLAGVNEDILPLKGRDEPLTAENLEEERRLMYVGITRAQRSLVVSWLKRRKRAQNAVAGTPSRFIAEMKLEQAAANSQVDPRERLKALRSRLTSP